MIQNRTGLEQSRDQAAHVSHEEEVPTSPIFRASDAAKQGQGDPSAEDLLSSACCRRRRRSGPAFPNPLLPEGLFLKPGRKCRHPLQCGTVRRVRMVTLRQGQSGAVAYKGFGNNHHLQNELSNSEKKKSIKNSKYPPALCP